MLQHLLLNFTKTFLLTYIDAVRATVSLKNAKRLNCVTWTYRYINILTLLLIISETQTPIEITYMEVFVVNFIYNVFVYKHQTCQSSRLQDKYENGELHNLAHYGTKISNSKPDFSLIERVIEINIRKLFIVNFIRNIFVYHDKSLQNSR